MEKLPPVCDLAEHAEEEEEQYWGREKWSERRRRRRGGGLEARWMRRGVRSGGEMRTGGEVGREVLQEWIKAEEEGCKYGCKRGGGC